MSDDHSRTTPAAQLRLLLGHPETLVVPGVFNALAARLFELEGFEALYVGGHGAAAATYGLPDIGLITQSEMADHIDRIAGAVSIPVIADADEGYGDVVNVARTVRRFERAGVAGIQIEDQELPKRCGHMERKRLISCAAMVGKIEAAIEARASRDTVIIARTDSIAVTGVDDAIERLQAYDEAGADLLFPDAPRSLEEIASIAEAVDGPLFVNISEGGKTPPADLEALRGLGVKLVIYPSSALFAAAYSIREVARTLRKTGTTTSLLEKMIALHDLNMLAGLAEWEQLEDRFSHRHAESASGEL